MSNVDILEALDRCAEEPVHAPGRVQDFAVLLAAEIATARITHASANASDILDIDAATLLGKNLVEVLGREFWHAVKNAVSRPDARSQALHLGDFYFNDECFTAHAFASGDRAIIEIERHQKSVFAGPEGLNMLRHFMDSVEKCENEDALFKATVEFLRHVSGYHRVMVYRFDREFNGDILAESRRSDMQSFLGLRFPHWDIPPQARSIMQRLTLRVIGNVAQEPLPLLALEAGADPLDISLAATRGVSPVHLEYLRNMGSQATMTLSIKIKGQLWGIISFHHESPRVPPAILREILSSIAQIFATKLQVLMQQSRLALVSRVEKVKDDILLESEEDAGMKAFMSSVLQVLNAHGIIVVQNNFEAQFGDVPDQVLVDELRKRATENEAVQCFDSLTRAFPELDRNRKGCAGALVFAPGEKRCLMVFRKELEQVVSWAGNPEKTIERVDGIARLTPRGSFAVYMEHVQGLCEPWSEQDLFFASRMWAVLNTLERRDLVASLSRQRKIMINELNHRVRNILALVRSVSRQAQRSSYGSLNSYARSLEARIEALAASHDLASTSMQTVVSVQNLVEREFKPFVDGIRDRFLIEGAGRPLRAEVAPIFSLVIHELVTNAVKYGALSGTGGVVRVLLKERDNGLVVEWSETGGPEVVEPEELGFGSTLIKQAIPYELDGDAQLEFRKTGVCARFHLPAKLFDPSRSDMSYEDMSAVGQSYDEAELLKALSKATCMIVEDNFVIAQSAQQDLVDMGVQGCEVAGSLEAAMDVLNAKLPTFAILDVNLGNGETSFPVAQHLLKKQVPFFFVTGYGETDHAPIAFKSQLRLTKPVVAESLKSALASVLLD